MKSQTLAVSIVLLLIAVATLPGLSFSLSSSVTSYNNSITINGGIIIPSDSKFHSTNVDELFKDENIPNYDSAYEIATSNGSFSSGKVSFNIPGNKTFIVNVKIDEYHLINPSGFDITIDTGNGNPDTASNIYGGSVSSIFEKSAQGYLYSPNKNSSNSNYWNWHLEKEVTNKTEGTKAKEFYSTNGDVTVTVIGTENRSTIHFYIIFIKDQEAGT